MLLKARAALEIDTPVTDGNVEKILPLGSLDRRNSIQSLPQSAVIRAAPVQITDTTEDAVSKSTGQVFGTVLGGGAANNNSGRTR